MTSAVLKAGGVTAVLRQGTSPSSRVSRFVQKFGSGVQHVAVAVKDLKMVSEALVRNGVSMETEIIEDEGIKQVFTVREAGCGVRCEMIERGGNLSRQSVERLFRTMEKRGAY